MSTDVSHNNTDPANWCWAAQDKEQWGRAREEWQIFRQEWYGEPEKSISTLLSVPTTSPSANLTSILIRECYPNMFGIIWKRAMTFEGRKSVIITGQPGTGKTCFLYYALVRLLQLKQAVLFSPDGVEIFLFFHDGVYFLPTEKAHNNILPIPEESTKAFMWSLFDIAAQAEPPQVLVKWPCFPVQTAFPSPTQFRIWSKNRNPLRTGLPLWSKEELAQGLRCQNDYQALKKAIETFYTRGSKDALASFPGAGPLLAAGFAKADRTPTFEEAVDFLLDQAIDRFGYAARDVFDAVFNHNRITEQHLSALSFGLDPPQFTSAVYDFVSMRDPVDSSSHYILALSPIYKGLTYSVTWSVDFKSDWIAKNIIRKLSKYELDELTGRIKDFTTFPYTRGMARRLFELMAHRHIAETAIAGAFWPLRTVNSDDTDAPHLTLTQDSHVPATVRLAKARRAVVEVSSIDELYVTNDSYYIPTDPTFPLFDSFAFDLHFSTRSGVLWVFQITTSRRNTGSRLQASGYEKVRKLVAKLQKRLLDEDVGHSEGPPPQKKIRLDYAPAVEVRYVLVVPDSEREVTDWYLPPGWTKHPEHRGVVYHLKLPLIAE